MTFQVIGDRDPFLHASLQTGERVYAESGAMVSMDTTLELNSKLQGGLLSALTRKFANDESLFTQSIVATGGPGDVLLAPALPGDIKLLDVGRAQYRLNDGAFLAATSGVEIRAKMQSLGKALFGGTGGFFVMETSGEGALAISSYGSIHEIDVTTGQDIVIDNQHVVAWDSTLRYEIGVSTSNRGFFGSLINGATSGEGLVTRYSGQGKVYLRSRNLAALTSHIIAAMPSPAK